MWWQHQACFAILGILTQTEAFFTQKCNHAEILDSIKGTSTCRAEEQDEIRSRPCLVFEAADKCAQLYLAPCFGRDTNTMSSIEQIHIRSIMQATMAQLNHPEGVVDALFAKCKKAPSKQEVESYDGKMFYWFDFARTDNDCSPNDNRAVQNGLLRCMERVSKNFKREVKKRVKGSNIETALCKVIHDTLGGCLFPDCFSKREVEYIRKELSSSFKAIVQGYFESRGNSANSNGISNLDAVGCLEGEGLNSAPTNCSVMSIVLLVLVTYKLFA